jgi:outer membrane protein TolC
MSANFPSFDLELGFVKRDEDLINLTKGEFSLPQDMSNALALISVPDSQKKQVQQAISLGMIPPITMPLDFESVVMGDKTAAGSLKMTYPIYSGGKISALQKQARIGKEIALEKDKRTKQEITFDVKKYYYGAIFTSSVVSILDDTYQKMNLLSELTEELYKGGSENVKKTDYLRTKMTTSVVKAMLEKLKSKNQLSHSALVFALGIDPQSKIKVDEQIENLEKIKSFDYFLDKAYENNKQLSILNKAIEVYDAKIDEVKSGYLPSVALFGSVDKIDNNYDGGMSNSQNDDSWSVGVGAKWNLFNGFRTKNMVSEAKLEKLKMQEQQKLLKNALSLQVKRAYLDMTSGLRELSILQESVKTAIANSDLNSRAYRADMVETKDVVEAQVMEAQIRAKYFQTLHEGMLGSATLDLLIGKY